MAPAQSQLKKTRFDRMYANWVHPGLRSDNESDRSTRQYFGTLFPGILAYLTFLATCLVIPYEYGIIASIVGLVSIVVSFVLLRYNNNLEANSHFGILSFALSFMIASLGAGGIGTIFSLPLIWLIWTCFDYSIKKGVIWTVILMATCVIFFILEISGFRIEKSFPEEDLHWFGLIFAFVCFGIIGTFFGISKATNVRLKKLLEESQELLIEKEKMASLGQLAAGIAHEINNPVNYIMNSAEALSLDMKDLSLLTDLIKQHRKQSANEFHQNAEIISKQIDLDMIINEISQMISGVKKGSEHITEIVKSLKHFSHPGQGIKVETNISELIDGTLVILKNDLEDRIEIIRNYNSHKTILAYPNQLMQVFLNILKNAIDSIPQKGVITVTVKEKEDVLILTFQDNGDGMSNDVSEHLFEPFYTTKAIGKGVGLGMSISYGIIQGHGGSLDVESEIGKGTIITVTLPFV